MASPMVTKDLFLNRDKGILFLMEEKKQAVEEGLVNKIWEVDTRNFLACRI